MFNQPSADTQITILTRKRRAACEQTHHLNISFALEASCLRARGGPLAGRRALGELVGLHLFRGEGVELLLELGDLGRVLLDVVLVAGALGPLELAGELLDLALEEVPGDLLPARGRRVDGVCVTCC